MKIADLLRRDQGGSAGIREAIARAEEAGREAGKRLEALTRERAEALLADDERRLDRVERDLVQVQRDADRADLAVFELRSRLETAEATERQAELDALYAAGMEAQRKGVGALHRRYPKLARAVADLADELSRLDAEITRVNRALRQAGDEREIESWELAARPRQWGQIAPGFLADLELPAGDRPGSLWPVRVGTVDGKAAA